MNTPISGIYAIRNFANNKLYIGSSKSIHYRWKENHIRQLRSGTHFNHHLQSAWNKYGESSFGLEVLEPCSESELILREGHWIEKEKSWDRSLGYNLNRIIDGKSVYCDETKQKLSARQDRFFWTTGINAQILDLHHQGLKKNTIAKQLGICRNAVYTCLENNGLHVRSGNGSNKKLTDDVKTQVVSMRNQNASVEDIIQATGVSRTQLYRVFGFNDGKYGTSKLKRATYRTLTPEVKEKAIKLREEGKSWRKIGEELGVSRQVFYWNGIADKQKNMVRQSVAPEIIDQIHAMRNEGTSWDIITERLCRAKGSLSRAYHNYRKSINKSEQYTPCA